MAKKSGKASAVPLGLVGRYFHHVEGNTIPPGLRHGVVRGQLSKNCFLVQYWDGGVPDRMQIIDMAELSKPGEWQFFEDMDHMEDCEAARAKKNAGA